MKYGLVIANCLFITTLSAIVSGCSQTESQGQAGAVAEPPAPVRLATIEQKNIAPEFRAFGNVRPRHMSVVASGSDGVVAAFPVEVGEFVSKDTVLSQLRNESTDLEIEEQEAILAECKAELEEIRAPRQEDVAEALAHKLSADIMFSSAKRRMQELAALSVRGAANPSEVKDAQEKLDDAEQTQLAAIAMLSKISDPRRETVMQAEARFNAQEKHVAFLEAERDKRTTKAPFTGFVVEEHTYVGQWLSKGAPVVTLAELDEVEVEVQIDQQYIDQIAPGKPVTLNVQGTGSLDGLSRDWTGEVDSVVPRSNWQNGSRSFPVIVRIENTIDESTMPPVPALREGMMAEAIFRGEDVDAVLVPQESMVRTSLGVFIYVINPPVEGESLSVRQVLVEPGLSSGTLIQVTGENLAADMQVVTEGAEQLRAFQTVVVKEDDREKKAPERKPPPPQPPALVRIATIEQKTISPEFRALGNVTPWHVSIVASGSDGVVAAFPVEVGEFVSKDTVLSELQTTSTDLEIEVQEAILAERKAELEEIRVPREEDKAEALAHKLSADITYSSAKRRMLELAALSARGAANPSEVKDAQETLDAAEQTQLAAIARLSKISDPRRETVMQAEAHFNAQKKHVAFLEAERDKRTTKAPFTGFVVEEHTYVGQWLSKGAPVVTLAELDEVEVEVQIDQQYVDQIAPGQQVTLNVRGSGSRNGLAVEWPGVVVSVVPRSNWQSGSRSFPVIVRIDNKIDSSTMPPVPALREGMVAEATFRGEAVDAILVPKDSMVRTSRGTFIYVINPPVEGGPLSVRQVLVEPGLSSGTWIQVTGANLAADMQVVTEGAERLKANQPVTIVSENSGLGIPQTVKSE